MNAMGGTPAETSRTRPPAELLAYPQPGLFGGAAAFARERA